MNSEIKERFDNTPFEDERVWISEYRQSIHDCPLEFTRDTIEDVADRLEQSANVVTHVETVTGSFAHEPGHKHVALAVVMARSADPELLERVLHEADHEIRANMAARVNGGSDE